MISILVYGIRFEAVGKGSNTLFVVTMKGGLRFAICISVMLMFSLYLLEAHLQDIYNQYRAGAYLVEWLNRNDVIETPVPIQGNPGDKVIVMAKLAEEHTDWVQEELPECVPPRSFSIFRANRINTNVSSAIAGNGPFT